MLLWRARYNMYAVVAEPHVGSCTEGRLESPAGIFGGLLRPHGFGAWILPIICIYLHYLLYLPYKLYLTFQDITCMCLCYSAYLPSHPTCTTYTCGSYTYLSRHPTHIAHPACYLPYLPCSQVFTLLTLFKLLTLLILATAHTCSFRYHYLPAILA